MNKAAGIATSLADKLESPNRENAKRDAAHLKDLTTPLVQATKVTRSESRKQRGARQARRERGIEGEGTRPEREREAEEEAQAMMTSL